MKILVDMNLSPKWVDFLIVNNIEAAHWSSIGLPYAPDNEIILYAKENEYTVLTNDLDFGFILAITHGEKPSVIQIRSDILSPDIIGGIIINAIKLLMTDIESGALITVDTHKTRVSLLPL